MTSVNGRVPTPTPNPRAPGPRKKHRGGSWGLLGHIHNSSWDRTFLLLRPLLGGPGGGHRTTALSRWEDEGERAVETWTLPTPPAGVNLPCPGRGSGGLGSPRPPGHSRGP